MQYGSSPAGDTVAHAGMFDVTPRMLGGKFGDMLGGKFGVTPRKFGVKFGDMLGVTFGVITPRKFGGMLGVTFGVTPRKFGGMFGRLLFEVPKHLLRRKARLICFHRWLVWAERRCAGTHALLIC